MSNILILGQLVDPNLDCCIEVLVMVNNHSYDFSYLRRPWLLDQSKL